MENTVGTPRDTGGYRKVMRSLENRGFPMERGGETHRRGLRGRPRDGLGGLNHAVEYDPLWEASGKLFR